MSLRAWLRRLTPVPLPQPERTSPVTLGRVEQVVQDRGYHVRAEEDGSLNGLWDGYRFLIRLAGTSGALLSVVGFWDRQVPSPLRSSLAQAVNDWNRDKIWPTVFIVEDADGATVRTEVVTDLTVGATDSQIAEALETGLAAGVQMLVALTGAMPPPKEASPEL